jgi:hypothetical protein
MPPIPLPSVGPVRRSRARGPWFALAAALALGASGCEGCAEVEFLDDTAVLESTSWRRGPSMVVARATHAAVEVEGDAIVLGGLGAGDPLHTVERCPLDAPRCEAIGALGGSHAFAAAVALPGDRVLVSPGREAVGFELFDLATGTARPTGAVTENGTLVRLADGRVVVIGAARTWVYQPTDDSWRDGPARRHAARGAAAAALDGGRVLVSGGFCAGCDDTQAELVDVDAGTAVAVAPMPTPRQYHRAVTLADGRVLAVGGARFDAPAADLYDPSLDTWTPAPGTPWSGLYHAATRLADNRVLVSGGDPDLPAVLFDPATDTWAPVPGLTARWHHAAIALPTGRALILGGETGHLDEPE